jgi:hypothetical protein
MHPSPRLTIWGRGLQKKKKNSYMLCHSACVVICYIFIFGPVYKMSVKLCKKNIVKFIVKTK